MEAGEVLLQWWVPSVTARVTTMVAMGRLWALGASLITVLAISAVGVAGMCLHEALILVALVLGLPASFVAFFLVFAYFFLRHPPRRWWVTNRRFLVGTGDKMETYSLDGTFTVEVLSRYKVKVSTGDREEKVAPLHALSELWGALLLGKAMSSVRFPLVDAEAPKQTITRVVCWHAEAKQPLGKRTRGVLVFRPETITWFPSSSGWVGDGVVQAASALAGMMVGVRTTRITPVVPIDGLFYRMLRIETEAEFDATLAAIVGEWGGGRLNAGDGSLKGSAVVIAVGDTVYTASNITEPGWPEIQQSLGLVDSNA